MQHGQATVAAGWVSTPSSASCGAHRSSWCSCTGRSSPAATRCWSCIEGRDVTGKDGAINLITERSEPARSAHRGPGQAQQSPAQQMVFPAFCRALPAAQEIALFNRSWYNRAGVEFIMKFCTRTRHEALLPAAPAFERILVRSGIFVLHSFLDMTVRSRHAGCAPGTPIPSRQSKLSPGQPGSATALAQPQPHT